MKNNIVSFELAKKLKEIGFDLQTYWCHIYGLLGSTSYRLVHGRMTTISFPADFNNLHVNTITNPQKYYSAPDYFTVLLWLEESKGIHVSWNYCEVTKNYTIVDNTNTMLFFDTLGECVEKLILLSLKQLENEGN